MEGGGEAAKRSWSGLRSLEGVLARLEEDARRFDERYGAACNNSIVSALGAGLDVFNATSTISSGLQFGAVLPDMCQLDLDLHRAVAANDLTGVDVALLCGANANTVTESMRPSCGRATPLVVASVNGHEMVLRRLLEVPDINPNIGSLDEKNNSRNNQTALMWAARLGHTSVVEALAADSRVEVNARTENGFTALDINKGKEVLNSRRITMANYTRNFELSFAKKIGVKYALMVNSGSSANLLATFAAGNPLKKNVAGG